MIKKAKNVSGVYYLAPHILQFENTNLISDEDIMHLFLGFIRLIKKSIELDMENKYINRIKSLESKLKMLNKNS